ncbi:ABC transporter ATP-binding protein [Microbacterium sp. RURRCA19A]|uniref:ABC transporter ATP-binding protein n=1 Tax=Microbacterium sp. RURRCA19A TaxID=1907391 RepID=UPI000953C708|nr:ATP-binding cassette domain-containing protein [Microbacterium sp. RURRCA19A]SIS00803.1 ABC-2 type transport system ATP-binding protein [Microbacterium sp. RURRCA19A]
MPQGQVLEFSGLTKRFGAVSAVDGLTARVEPGLVTGFLGPNGAGKTTSLRMLLGLVRPTSGSATIGGRRYSDIDRPLQTVGAALEASSFHPGRSASNHLKAYARAARLPLSRVDEVLGLVGLADVAGRRVGGYSLGMRQRLGLATALIGDPGVLVLDEPSNGLDPEGIRWMRSLLRHLAEEGRTVLISSHLLAEVQQTVDALLIISRGKLVFQGGTEDLADPDEYSTVVDSPDREALSRLLEERGIPFQLLRNGFTIRHVEPLEIGTLAAGAGIVLSHLQSKGASLEDIFLELVSGVRTHASAAGVTANPDATVAAPEPAAATPEPVPVVADPAPSTDLVPVAPAPRSFAPPVAPEPRRSYAVASTGVIDIVPVDDARAEDTEVPR